MAKEGFFDHIARRASILAERLELEACHAGTDEAEMNRHIFSATKKNTKAPKERTVQDILKLCNDPASIVACLRLITTRLSKSTDAVSIIKTISVWLRCLSSGDSQFVQLCSDYVNLKIVSQDASDNCALVFANTGCEYVQMRLQAFSACKHEYEKESGKSKLISLEPQVMLHQMAALMTQIEVIPKVSDSEISGIGSEACKYLLGQLCGDCFPILRAITQGLEVLFQSAGTLQEKESEQYLMVLVRLGKFTTRMQQLLDQDRAMINTEMLLDPKVIPKLDKLLAETSERVKGVWAADAVKAKFKVGSPSSGGSPSSASAAGQPSPQASDDWANFGSAPAAASAAGSDWAAFPSAPAVAPAIPARTAPAAAPRPAAAASLLDDLFTSAPASAPAAHNQHQQPAQAWGAPAPATASVATKPVTGGNLLDDFFSAAPAQAAPVAQFSGMNLGGFPQQQQQPGFPVQQATRPNVSMQQQQQQQQQQQWPQQQPGFPGQQQQPTRPNVPTQQQQQWPQQQQQQQWPQQQQQQQWPQQQQQQQWPQQQQQQQQWPQQQQQWPQQQQQQQQQWPQQQQPKPAGDNAFGW